MRIGLIADTHMPGSLRDLWPQAIEVFQGVDVILHAGDLHTLDIVDELNRIAPVYVAKGNGDMDLVDHRLQDTWHLEFGGVSIAMIHRFPSPDRKSPALLRAYTERHFGDIAPHVVIYGHTHLESTHLIDDVLYVNPGSPTLPRNQSLRLGTLGVLEIGKDPRDGTPRSITASIHQLTEHGADLHDEVSTLTLALPARRA
jgi:hypothetical protein